MIMIYRLIVVAALIVIEVKSRIVNKFINQLILAKIMISEQAFRFTQ